METALRLLGAFIVLDLIAAFALVVLVGVVHRRRGGAERPPRGPLIGALVFLGLCSILIYGGIWMCLRVL